MAYQLISLLTLSLWFCRDCLTVQFLLSKQFLAALPNKELKSGALIPVVPVLFTQGVNEKQTLANLKNE